MDSRRVMMRVPKEAPLPLLDDEVMIEELESHKWRVEMAAAGAAVLVSSSLCPHGLGLLPSTLAWQGGGRWRPWPGTFEHKAGSLITGGGVTWAAISESLACQGSPGIKQVGKEHVGVTVEACQAACQALEGCRAVDYYRSTKWCILYDAPCKGPKKNHDQASSWTFTTPAAGGAGLLEEGDFTFLDAKKRCQELETCGGFSFSGTWSEKDQHSGRPHRVYFSSGRSPSQGAKGQKWSSFLLKDNPRANCNPEGRQFDCPENPFACLGLSIDADDAAVKQAYRTLSKRLHPDKLTGAARTKAAVAQAEVAFREMSEAHETLRDPRQRRQIDHKMRVARQQWEKQRESILDLYVKEPLVTTLEPESYPLLIPLAREWLVHFFLPSNDDCKQMKMAMQRAADLLGTGEEEREAQEPEKPPARHGAGLREGEIFRGVVREKSTALRSEGAGMAEGDTHIAMVVQRNSQARLYLLGEETDVAYHQDKNRGADGRMKWVLTTKERIYTGSFDRSMPDWLRGTVAEASNPTVDVGSFALRLDRWSEPKKSEGDAGGRMKPRLFGAVNCGRFPDFCKRKGADASFKNRFPQVRMLFPEELRYELYRGRTLGREVAAFAKEASRATGEVQKLDREAVLNLQAQPAAAWVLLLQSEATARGKMAWDCALCRSALPALRRTAPRLADAGVRVGWLNCSAEATACRSLGNLEEPGEGEASSTSEWGSFHLVELGHRPGVAARAPPAELEVAPPAISVPLWDSRLLVGETGQAVLLSALEAAAGMAKLLGAGQEPGRGPRPASGGEL